MKKIFSLILAITLAFTMIPFGLSASAETEEGWDFYTARIYNQESAPDITDTDMFGYSSPASLPDREFTRDYAPCADEWSLKLTKKAGTAVDTNDNIWFKNFIDADYAAEASGMRIWVANPAETTVNLRWNYNAEYTGGETTYSIKSGQAYYLQSASSVGAYSRTTAAYSNDHGLIQIPAGFKGWLYIPFPATRAHEYTRIRLFINATADDADTSVYVSRLEYYSSTAVTALTNLDYTFDSILAVNSDHVNGSNTSVTAEYRDGNYGQSLKITEAAAGSYRFTALCGRLASETASGIKFWIKNTEENALKLMVMLTDSYANINSGAVYYLKPENGDAYTSKTVAAHESGRYSIVIPAEFTGYVYIPYTAQPTNLKKGHFILNFGDSSATGATVYIDSFGNFDFSDLELYNLIDFDSATDVSSNMWSYDGVSTLSTDYTDGGTGNSVKTTLNADSNTIARFNNLITSTSDGSNQNSSLGYRVWVYNPNSFAISAFPQFTDTYNRALVGKEYYLVTESGITGHLFKGLASDAELGCVTLPAGFKGYIYIPKNSIYNNSSINFTSTAVNKFILNFLASGSTGSVYVDSIGLYNSVASLTAADLNGDSAVNVLDLIRMKKYAADSSTFINNLCLDIDGSGTVDIAVDIAALRKVLLGAN